VNALFKPLRSSIEISKQLNVSHYSTVSQTIGPLNALIIEDNEVRAIYNKLSQDLTLLILSFKLGPEAVLKKVIHTLDRYLAHRKGFVTYVLWTIY
jgi:hypothetical protein